MINNEESKVNFSIGYTGNYWANIELFRWYVQDSTRIEWHEKPFGISQ